MAWSYSGDPATSPRDAVRYRIGDTDPADPLLQDVDIDFELAEARGDVRLASIGACRSAAAKLSRQIDISDDGTALKLSQRRDAYLKLAAALEAAPVIEVPTPSGGAPLPFAGGIACSRGGHFRLGMHDHP